MPMVLRPYRTTRTDTLVLSATVTASCVWQITTGQFAPKLVDGTSLTAMTMCTSLMAVGFALVFLGVVWRGTNHVALSIEMVGRATLVLPSAAYGLLLMHLVGGQGAVTEGFCLALAASSFYRATFITWRLHQLHQGLLKMSEDRQ